MIIDRTYFVGEINIPNANTTAVSSLIDRFIEKYEPIFLQIALGYELYKEFTQGLAAPVIEQKWKDLRDGVEYTTCSGDLHNWKGLITDDPKESLIANYVYYWHARNHHTQTASVGEVKSAIENSVMSNQGEKMVRAWNEMSAWRCELSQFLSAKKDIYPAYNKADHYHISKTFRPINTFGV